MTPSNTKTPQSSIKRHHLLVGGASCASCVGKIEKALNGVSGVTDAQMNLPQSMATVYGNVDESDLIDAIKASGYNATSATEKSDEHVINEKDAADHAYYNKLLRDTAIALGLGVPLMVYGLFIGDMSVTTNAERIAWANSRCLRPLQLWQRPVGISTRAGLSRYCHTTQTWIR